MYGAPGPGYQGHNKAENQEINKSTNVPDSIMKVGPRRASTVNTTSTARLIYPEYMCFFPTIFLRGGAGACEQSCPEEVRENAKCQRNGWIWAERLAELRAAEVKVKRKTMADRDKEKEERESETETEGPGNGDSENGNKENDER